MNAAIRAEFRKLLTVRSTYLIVILSLLLAGFTAGYILGYHDRTPFADPSKVSNGLLGLLPIISAFGSIAGVLLMAHEYRYNTIMYSLTISNSRSKVLAAKVLVLTVYAAVYTLLVALAVAGATYAGVALAGHQMAPQTIFFADTGWRVLFYMWANVMAGLLFAVLFRNLVAAVAATFLLPGMIEGLLSLLLNDKSKYLPFNSLNYVLHPGDLSAGQGAGIFMAYLLAAGLAAWMLFLRRDAN